MALILAYPKQATTTQQAVMGEACEPSAPARVLDTRTGTGAPARQVGPGGVVAAQIAGVAANIKAVLLNITATDATAGSYLTAYPDHTAPPLASILNFGPGQTEPNLVIATVGPDRILAAWLTLRNGQATRAVGRLRGSCGLSGRSPAGAW